MHLGNVMALDRGKPSVSVHTTDEFLEWVVEAHIRGFNETLDRANEVHCNLCASTHDCDALTSLQEAHATTGVDQDVIGLFTHEGIDCAEPNGSEFFSHLWLRNRNFASTSCDHRLFKVSRCIVGASADDSAASNAIPNEHLNHM